MKMTPTQEMALSLKLERKEKVKKDKSIVDLEMSINDQKNRLAMNFFKEAIKLKKETAFVNPSITSDEEALGILVSQFAKWDGQKIFDVSYNAFEDSNFHSFNEKFEQEWKKEGK